ncbi:MAG: pseudouridine synthase [Eubacteriales bacterium]
MERLDKILSDAQVASRRELKPIIKAGRVRVNGAVITKPEQKFDRESSEILVDGAPIRREKTVVVLLHKPAGVVTSTEDSRDKTVLDILPKQYGTLHPIGRLDKETEGLLLLTNDGLLTHHLISPSHQVEKIYYAKHENSATKEDVEAFAKGLILANGDVCLPAKLESLGAGESRIIICQGMYHQVRRMMASRQMHVTYLRREGEANLRLSPLAVGDFRELTGEEVENLRL